MNNPQETRSAALQRVLKREVVGRKFDDLLYSLLEEYNELEKELAKRDEALDIAVKALEFYDDGENKAHQALAEIKALKGEK